MAKQLLHAQKIAGSLISTGSKAAPKIMHRNPRRQHPRHQGAYCSRCEMPGVCTREKIAACCSCFNRSR
nr:MAG TPA: hypothetical protein [Caudoviricetes sp.]